MIARALSWFTRPDPVAKAADDLQDARCRFAEAHRDHCVATERQDTRRMGLAAVNLRAANTRLIEAERAYEEARA
jgi:hypothetical protein